MRPMKTGAGDEIHRWRRFGMPAAVKKGDFKPPNARVWRRFALAFIVTFFGGLGVVYAGLVFLDPYDTGRFPSLLPPGHNDARSRTANASRARDPRFDAAVFGNSRGQMIEPERMSQATGLSFAQLTTPGSGPREHVTMMRYFLAHHRHIDTIVLTTDERWCIRDPSLPATFPFPFWLYRGNAEYLGSLLRTNAIAMARNRVRLALHLTPPGDLRGFFDYDTGRQWKFHPNPADLNRPLPTATIPPVTDFPALHLLDALLAEFPAQTRIVIMAPPVYRDYFFRLNPEYLADLPNCKAALAQRAQTRPRSAFLDFFVDSPVARDPVNFMDPEHYRLNVARMIEDRILVELAGMRPHDRGSDRD